jgi:hypothetical protein
MSRRAIRSEFDLWPPQESKSFRWLEIPQNNWDKVPRVFGAIVIALAIAGKRLFS